MSYEEVREVCPSVCAHVFFLQMYSLCAFWLFAFEGGGGWLEGMGCPPLPCVVLITIWQPSAAQRSPVQTSAVQHSVAQPTQPSAAQRSPAQPSAAQRSPVQTSAVQHSVAQPTQPSAAQRSPAQRSAAHGNSV
jgi:hypothetical protein